MATNSDIFQHLINLPCWRPWRGYQYALFFEFGEALPSPDGKPRQGKYTVCLDECPWQVFHLDTVLCSSKSEYKVMDEVLPLFQNKKMEKIEFYPELHQEALIFSGELSIRTYHNDSRDAWHLLSPQGAYTFTKAGIKKEPSPAHK